MYQGKINILLIQKELDNKCFLYLINNPLKTNFVKKMNQNYMNRTVNMYV